jgi:hypothetical protein
MSRGPGAIERRIAELFAATSDQALGIDAITRHAFETSRPTRAQRLSATRAAHRLLRRMRDAATDARHLDLWRASTVGHRLLFHRAHVPVEVWAVTLDRTGVHWFPAEITKITDRNVMVRYRGSVARLDRFRLWHSWAWWRAVMFTSSQTGHVAAALEELWWQRYGTKGAPPPAMRMPLAEARATIGVGEDYSRDDVIAAFRRKAKAAHPDAGGTAEMFRLLVEARDRLLAALGTSAPAPKPPNYAPKGVQVVYRVGRTGQRRLGAGIKRLT